MTEIYDAEGARRYMETQEDFYAEHADETRDALYSLLPANLEGLTILDAGCGCGSDVKKLCEMGAQAYGIDASESMIQLATERYPINDSCLPGLSDFHYRQATFDNIPATDGLFDIIISRYALQYAEDIGAAYRELHRVLKPRGSLVALVAHPMLQYQFKKKNYYQPETIQIPIYGGTFTVESPTHTIEEYINTTALSLFDLEYTESQKEDSKSREKKTEDKVPEWLLMKWRKR